MNAPLIDDTPPLESPYTLQRRISDILHRLPNKILTFFGAPGFVMPFEHADRVTGDYNETPGRKPKISKLKEIKKLCLDKKYKEIKMIFAKDIKKILDSNKNLPKSQIENTIKITLVLLTN